MHSRIYLGKYFEFYFLYVLKIEIKQKKLRKIIFIIKFYLKLFYLIEHMFFIRINLKNF